MHGGDLSQHCDDMASALEERLLERADRTRRAMKENPPEPDYETNWDRILAVGCEIERANHGGGDVHELRRPGDDPRTADRRDGIEPAVVDMPRWAS